MPTLAELRAQSGPKPLPRTTKVVTLVEGQHLLAEVERLSEEHGDLAMEAANLKRRINGDEDGKRTGPPLKSGEGAKLTGRLDEIEARQAEIKERLEHFADDLAEVQGEVGLRGMTGGDWQRFKDENPPREDNAADVRFAAGVCDSSALFAALGKFVETWNGETVSKSDWNEWLGELIAYADRRDMVSEVVGMHERGLGRSPKFRSASATTSPSESA
jgi:hypothetical protein